MAHLNILSSHIDILPTILGLAGIDRARRDEIQQTLSKRFADMADLPGLDLSPLLRGETSEVLEEDGTPRQGVLFITSDAITAPLPVQPGEPVDPHSEQNMAEFAVFNVAVEVLRHGTPNRPPLNVTPSSVKQPNSLHCVRSQRYKLARYYDPGDASTPQEWEMYDLLEDPNETCNLVQVAVTPPVLSTNLPCWADSSVLNPVLAELQSLLSSLEARNL